METGKFDMLLYMASEDMIQPDIDLYNSEDGSVVFSKQYDRRLNRFLKRINRQEAHEEWKSIIIPLKRIAVAVMLICTISLGCVLSIKAVREAIWNTILSWYDKRIEVTFVPEDTDVISNTTIVDYREPTAGLDGYEKFELIHTPSSNSIEYENGDRLIIFTQSLLNAASVNISNNDTIVRDVIINGFGGVYGEYISNGICFINIVWSDGEYQYSLEGNESLDRLIAVAESVK